ncbi:MAG: EamA family transporter [Burkholderiales bacterium]
MTLDVIAAVLLGALLHALWNTLAKRNAGRAGDAVVVGILAGIPAALTLPFTPLPLANAWPQIFASAIIHVGYFKVLAGAYRGGDLSVAYPLMRGLPPLVVAASSILVFGEALSLTAWGAMLMLIAGILVLGWDGLRAGALTRSAARFVAIQIVIIVCYTLVDASGVRAAGNAWSYIAWMFALTSVALLPVSRPSLRAIVNAPRWHFFITLLGALCTLGSYGIALWAMTRAPVALVAALRETSILFGAALGAWLLGERFGATRWFAVFVVTCGVAAMRMV